jgi:plasmid stabilization system protein ParE
MMALRWAPGAVADLVRLRSFLGDKNPAAAARAAQRLREAAALLRSQPELGHAVDGEVFRDLLAPFGGGAYVLRYRIDDDAVVIVRVWHGREERR